MTDINLVELNTEFISKTLEQYRREIESDISPQHAANLLNRMAAVWAMVNEVSIQAEMEYNRKFEKIAGKHDKVTFAKAQAETSPEYERMRLYEGKVQTIEQMMRALKYTIKVKISEQEQTRRLA